MIRGACQDVSGVTKKRAYVDKALFIRVHRAFSARATRERSHEAGEHAKVARMGMEKFLSSF